MDKSQSIKSKIVAKDVEISVITDIKEQEDDYISLTDIAKYKNPEFPADVVKNWLRLRSTIEFLGLWESLNNPNFNMVDFDQFKNDAGSNSFVLSPQKWISSTNAIGIISKSGRYGGGTFAHKDIAFEFASWVSPEFKLYVIKDYQRLKEDESHRVDLDWNVKRILSKANYKIHTDAIKENLIPPHITAKEQGFVYASEADVLNMALFHKTAKQWRQENPDKKGNIRDFATIDQLLVLTNLENANAIFIKQNMPQSTRLKQLNEMAIEQLTALSNTKSSTELNQLHNQLKLPINQESKKKLQ